MLYKKVTAAYEPSITGSRNGVYSVELNNKSFINKSEKVLFESFFKKIILIGNEFLLIVMKFLIILI